MRRTRAKPLDVAECHTKIVSGTLVYFLCSWWFLHTCRYHSVRGLVPHWLQVRHQLSAAHCDTRGWPGQSHARLLHDLELHGYCGGFLAHWPQVRPDATWFWKMLGGAVFAPWCCHCQGSPWKFWFSLNLKFECCEQTWTNHVPFSAVFSFIVFTKKWASPLWFRCFELR